jgi:hypothetical protein
VERALPTPIFFLSFNQINTRALLQTKPPPPYLKGINIEDIFQARQAWASENMTKSKNEEEGEDEQQDQYKEIEEKKEQKVNSFWDIFFGVGEEEEEEVE